MHANTPAKTTRAPARHLMLELVLLVLLSLLVLLRPGVASAAAVTEIAYNHGVNSDYCGGSVEVGDFNGDARQDIAISCSGVAVGGVVGVGGVAVHLRSADNSGWDAPVLLTRPSPATSDNCASVKSVGVGDVNGDGRDDVAVGCTHTDFGGVLSAGSALIFLRNSGNTGFDTAVEVTKATPTGSDQCGGTVAVGDVNADGRDDLAMGCHLADPGATTSAGEVQLVTRNAGNTGFDTAVTLSAPSPVASDNCGKGVAIGDVNGDARADVLMGCDLLDPGTVSAAGGAYLFTRNSGNTGFDAGALVTRAMPVLSDNCGADVEVGNINGDTFGDIVMSCQGADPGGIAAAGAAIVLLRNAGNTGFDADAELSRASPKSSDGCLRVALGDSNADGRDDVIMGCNGSDVATIVDPGRAIYFRRNAANTGFDAPMMALSPDIALDDMCGSGVAFVNSDGSADGTLEPAHGCVGRDTAGANDGAVLVGGEHDATAPSVPTLLFPGPSLTLGFNPGFQVGYSDNAAFGWVDIEVCSSADCTTVTKTGATGGGLPGSTQYWGPTRVADSTIYWRARASDAYDNIGVWSTAQALVVAHAEQPINRSAPVSSDYCSQSMASGDVNGDGRHDLVLGCPQADPSATSAAGLGLVAIRNATNTGFDYVELARSTPVASDYCGAEEGAAMGDVNGDGRDDVILGCRLGDPATLNAAGFVLVFTRNAGNTGFDAAVELTRGSPVASDTCGNAVVAADFNGDLRDDIAFSCDNADPGAVSAAGMVLVALRNSANTGFDTPVELARPGALASDYCGREALSAGDLNGDGRDDIAMPCQKRPDGTAGGTIWAFLRNTGNTGFDAGVAVGPTTGPSEGCFRQTVAELNGDARADIAISCQGADHRTAGIDAGMVRVYARNAANTGFEEEAQIFRGKATYNDNCGFDLSSGDVDGDGRTDLVVGCSMADPDAVTSAGLGMVIRRNAANTGWLTPIEVSEPTFTASTSCGTEVQAADVDGDGRWEPILGCDYGDPGGVLSGGLAYAYPFPVITAGPNPSDPSALAQYRADATTAIPGGTWTTDGVGTNVVLTFTVSDPEASQTLTPWVEYRPYGTAFSGTCGTGEAGAVVSGATVSIATAGATATATVNVTGLASGTTYVWRACAVDQSANASGWTSRGGTPDFGVDASAPQVPALVSPADAATTSSASLTATYSDTAPASPGSLGFEVCSDAACTTVLESGGSSTGLASGSNGSWTHTRPSGSYYWRARSIDGAGAVSAWSATRSFTLQNAPVTTLTSPTAAGWVTSRTPTLSASQTDGDGDSARIEFEVCSTSAVDPWSSSCGGTYERVDATSVASGGTGTVTINRSRADGAWYWRARGIDTGGAAGAWATPQLFNVDATPPTLPGNVEAMASGKGAITLSWTASTDAGFGAIAYDAAVSADGVTWVLLCNDVTTTSCRESGLGGVQYRFMRVNACDGLANCTSWVGTIGSVGVGHNLRTSVNSTLLTGPGIRAATVGFGTANVATSIENADAMGWYTFVPGQLDNTSTGTEPANTPTERGWIVDAVSGRSLAKGSWEMVLKVSSDFSTGVGRLQCRAWTVTTSGGAISSATFLAKHSSTVDVLIVGTSTIACPLPGFAAQRSFAANEAIYVEALLNVSTAGHADSVVYLEAEGEGSYLALPGISVGPDVPSAPFAATGTATPNGPTMSSTYSHPTPVDGAVEYQLASDNTFITVVGQGTSAKVISGSAAPWVAPTLTPGVQYWWRARAIDTDGVSSAWSATQTFTTAAAPAAPTAVSPTSTTASTSPTFSASAFSDTDSGDTHSASQWQLRSAFGSYSTPVEDSATTTTSLTSWTTTATLTSGSTYHWRVRYRDSYGVWSDWSAEATFSVGSGATLSLSLDNTSVAMGTVTTGSDAVASTVATAGTDAVGGYALTAKDGSDTTAATCACGGSIADWTGTGTTPSSWPAGTAGYMGLTVRDATGGRLAKWGTGTGTTETDFTGNLFSGMAESTSATLHQTAAASSGDQVKVTYRVNAAAATKAGSYSSTISYTIVTNP